MRKFVLYLSVLFFAFSCSNQQPNNNLLTKGISLELAKYRKKQIKDVFYQLTFDIPKKKTEKIPAKLKIELTVLNTTKDLLLDFNEKKSMLQNVSVNGKDIDIHHEKEHLIIAKNNLKKGKNTLQIAFNAGELSLNRNEDFLYTLLVPDRASTLFPCFDQPDIKAIYQLTITAPKNWKVLCGATEIKQKTQGDFTTHYFGKTDKMSTYLFSFVAGKFFEQQKETTHLPMRFLYRETNAEKVEESVKEAFNLHQKSVDFLEEYTQYPFPFQKLDFVSIPPFQYGGMEHVGAIQYRESALFLDKNATQSQKIRRAKLIGHETAHMWFGDLVTMRWFNDVWLKEVFANFMADKIVNPLFPKTNHRLSFMMSHYPSAYSEDRTEGTNPIRQELANLKNAGTLYGRIIYNKSPIMMRQLELLLGKEKFKEGLQKYIKKHENSNADWNDLVSILDEKSSKDIKQWSNIWVNSSGRPVFTDEITYKDGKIAQFTIHQKAEDKTDKIWEQQFSIGLLYNNEVKEIKININSDSLSVKKALQLPKPKQIIYNYNGLGYGVFPIDKEKTKRYKDIKNDVARGYSFINLYENMLVGNMSTLKAYSLFLEALSFEKNELIAKYISERISATFWKFLTKEQQLKVQQKTEATLFSLLPKNLPTSIKRTYFNLYKSIAFSEKGKEHLYQIWKGNTTIKNVVLNENDKIGLAMQLAVFQHKKASEILNTQKRNIQNKDRLARFKWLLPTLSNKKTVRNEFMKSLTDAKNREKEQWVETALSYIHHPLRYSSSVNHLKLCLDLLEEIQLTGDIFFPKRWLQSSLGNYSSKEAFDIVNSFLQENPQLKPVLKNKLLQVADGLKRAQKIKK